MSTNAEMVAKINALADIASAAVQEKHRRQAENEQLRAALEDAEIALSHAGRMLESEPGSEEWVGSPALSRVREALRAERG